MSKILVVADHDGGALKKITLNSIEFAKQWAAKTGGSFDVAVFGQGVGVVAQALTGYGAAAVHAAARRYPR